MTPCRRRLCFIASVAFAAAAGGPAAAQSRPDVKAELSKIEQHLEAWDIPAARAAVEALSRVAPKDAEALLYFQGRVAFEEGDYPRAVELLEQASMEDRPGSYLRLAKDTLQVTREHHKTESEHFIFLHPAGKDAILAPYALEALEAIRSALVNDLGHAPPGKVRVELVNDARELAKVSTLTRKQIETTGTIAICKFNKLMVTSPKAVLRGYDWLDTLSHEYVHLVVSQKSQNTVPIWLHEGLAKYLESRWRGPPGLAMAPATLALLGDRVKKNRLIPFAKMHPSIALLPSAEDAATAFAEVFFAIDYLYQHHGNAGLRAVIDELRVGRSDQRAVEKATGKAFAAFEKAWLSHVKTQPFPKELLPLTEQKVVLKDGAQGARQDKKGREISFGDFAEVEEVEARRLAHLGELLRERKRIGAAAEEYGRAHRLVGDKYESISNKYALALFELRRVDEAERVLQGSLRVHPGAPGTQVKLGRVHLLRKNFPRARAAYLDALASDPFDPEIHFALLRIHQALGEPDRATRARSAASVLTGLPADEVERIAQSLVKEDDLSQTSADEAISHRSAAGVHSAPAGAPPTGVDAGTL